MRIAFATVIFLFSIICVASPIEHLVVVIQENHSFDSYFGRYCKANTGSNPSCNFGPDCCEAGPEFVNGVKPVLLNDVENMNYDPNHSQACELKEINKGRMDLYTKQDRKNCGDPRNFAYANEESAAEYWSLANQFSLGDRYFQPVIGESSSNDMYFARAQYVFTDNDVGTKAIGSLCGDGTDNRQTYTDTTIGDLLTSRGVSWAFYAEGYQTMMDAQKYKICPLTPNDCGRPDNAYPCIYDPTDNPFQYYQNSLDNPVTQRDFAKFSKNIQDGELPSVSFVKAIGYKTEHPGLASITAGEKFVSEVLSKIFESSYMKNTLILIVPDESGGFFDHISPPEHLNIDGQLMGPRVPILAVGYFAQRNYISHVEMEHSSIVKFIEWNWLGETGQLRGRDQHVNNIGSLLNPEISQVPAQ